MPAKAQTPLAITVLGYGGLIPFVAGVVAVITPGVGGAVFAFTVYAVTILAFLGGIQWGFAMATPAMGHAVERLAVGVLAPLLAAGTFFVGPVVGLALLIGAFVALLLWEGWRRSSALPDWYLPLRLRLTTGVVLCLAIVLATLI